MSDTQQDTKLYSCPDCARELLDELHPISDFYLIKVREYKEGEHWVKYARGVRRSTYCKMHTDRRTSARLRAKLDPESPEYSEQLHQSQKASKRDYYNRKLRPESPEYDPTLHERQKQAKRDQRAAARETRRDQSRQEKPRRAE